MARPRRRAESAIPGASRTPLLGLQSEAGLSNSQRPRRPREIRIFKSQEPDAIPLCLQPSMTGQLDLGSWSGVGPGRSAGAVVDFVSCLAYGQHTQWWGLVGLDVNGKVTRVPNRGYLDLIRRPNPYFAAHRGQNRAYKIGMTTLLWHGMLKRWAETLTDLKFLEVVERSSFQDRDTIHLRNEH